MNRPPNPRKRPASDMEQAWVNDEDRFVLAQAKSKAALHVRENRANPIDWLAVSVRWVDPDRDPVDDEIPDEDLGHKSLESVFDGMTGKKLEELEKEIELYSTLETSRHNRAYWKELLSICEQRNKDGMPAANSRGFEYVEDRILRELKKGTLDELLQYEKQNLDFIATDPPDSDFYETVVRRTRKYIGRAKLRNISQRIIDKRADQYRKLQIAAAEASRSRMASADLSQEVPSSVLAASAEPKPLASIGAADKNLEVLDEDKFRASTVSSIASRDVTVLLTEKKETERKKAKSVGFFNAPRPSQAKAAVEPDDDRFSHLPVTARQNALRFEHQASRRLAEGEEMFEHEEDVATQGRDKWAEKHRPRKPLYSNRVLMGYEWNKYNQTHYDHDNPPPKAVQGYKFNVFYPELIDKKITPSYKIEREHGRKRGQSFAPAGEEDTCLIRFTAGPPYEDIAFRIVDREWDYSSKRERGFKAVFENDILQVHFQFKRVFYRK